MPHVHAHAEFVVWLAVTASFSPSIEQTLSIVELLHRQDPHDGDAPFVSNLSAKPGGSTNPPPADLGLLQAILEQTSIGMFLVGPDMRWIYANPAFCALIGYTQAECVGMTVDQIMHPDDLAQAHVDIAALRQGRTGTFRTERRYLRKDGGIIWVTTCASNLDPDAGAQPCTHLVEIIDIGGHRQAAALIEAKSRENTIYQSMIEALPDLIFAKDLTGRFLASNSATATFMGAHDVGQIIGKTDSAFYPPDVATRFHEDEQAFFMTGKTIVLEQPSHRGDGPAIILQSTKSLLTDENGQTIGYVGHGKDITEEKRREEALAQAHAKLGAQNEELQEARLVAERTNLAKSQFLAAMSHEIRTPMTAVLGMADLLASEELTPTQRRYVETIRKSGRHLLSIINDILDFSRIEAGRLDLERIDFTPLDILEQAQSLLMPHATERGLDLRIEARMQSSLVVQGDPTRLQQILVNLTGNALKFTTQGEVVVALREHALAADRTLLRFEVRDTGIGIPVERQAQLFEAFVQADSSIARHYGGSGLGLAICKRLVTAMGGTIGVVSQPGQGSTFWFELPMSLGDPRAVAPRSLEAQEPMEPLRILVVDDVAVNRELLNEMLRRSGHEVAQAEDGAQAVASVGRGGFDVVLMDVQMPVMDGIEATRRIRRLPLPMKNVPIFALTANVMESEHQRHLASGMNGCLTKPIVWHDLFAALAGVLPNGRPALIPTAAPVAAAEVTDMPPEKPPLLDRALIHGMASKLPAPLFQQMLTRGLNGAQESCGRLRATLGDPDVMAGEAHRLRGTAGTFGLARIAALAGDIEDLLRDRQQFQSLVDQLDEAVQATQAAIIQAPNGSQ